MADLTEVQLRVLKTELTTDPQGITYTDGSGTSNEQHVKSLADAERLNSYETGRTTDTDFREPWEIFGATEKQDLKSLSADDLQLFQTMLNCGRVEVQNPRIREILQTLFAGTGTLVRLTALQREPTSRAMELFGQDVASWDVSRARSLR
jgi:hypothetical protein